MLKKNDIDWNEEQSIKSLLEETLDEIKNLEETANKMETIAEQAEKHKADTAIFEGIKTLIGQEVFKDASLVAELTDELEQGETSMLARFIRFQSAENSFDAALSFIVWKRFKFLAELEKEFGISLDYFRTLNGADFLCAPKSNMFVTKF